MFGNRIKLLRLSYNLNQVELAKHLSVSKQTVSNWENGYIQPSIDILIRIADFFSVSTDYLLGIDDKTYIEVTGLTPTQLTHIQQIIDDITARKSE